ncbi:anhydro-N-acetylmuramic acid kinase [Clostridium sp. YIM B02515]|uniref:Anhydro-N-acetylmuramic acid kinase n=1 Tax=Clostridium rhizosphaerae TaxID=2803861 RepID=A0ABS1T5W0_9CLOT|nr:anhydro-N-acetylmuramic acid kinase AnmK [Clostridium rhizosphaerae]MBL4934728.1 anhydro-N-acetylmuramic acid kinase [Clostridium rhizosphaerae]
MEKYIVGLMSGTSLDGIDSALVKISGSGENTNVELIDFINKEIPEDIKNEIMDCFSVTKSNVELICSVNFKLGYLFAQAVKEVCSKANFDISKLDLIGSHGQTVYHVPKGHDNIIESTLQIGEPAVIAYETGVTVVSNFRTMDMAAGGQGAPLVPYTEYLLYRTDKNRALQNIGGIGNVTVIPKKCSMEQMYAFDTGPGNMIMDEVTKRLQGQKYDKGGYFASLGKVNEDMLKELMSIEYINAEPPKTTGREFFGSQFVDRLLEKWGNLEANDIIATVTMFTAKSIALNYREFVFNAYPIEEVILGGGGSYNNTLVSMIKELLPECKVMIQEDLGYSSDAKEAIAFAVLANETINGNAGNVLGATGAKERVILGNITPVPYKR